MVDLESENSNSAGEAFVEVRHSISGGPDELAFLTSAEERIPQQESCLLLRPPRVRRMTYMTVCKI